MGVASDKRIKRILRKVITLLLVGEAILGMNAYCGETTIKNSPHNLWSKEKAWQWYRNVSPVRGCNYLPRTAVNMTEMWQADTFDPKTIDEELGWAEKAGYNSVRIYLQYLVWNDDPEGLKKRVDEFLTIADKHGISSMLILFCDCAFSGKEPYLGKQDEPIPGVHNSGWVPSPGLKRVTDKSVWPDLEKYVDMGPVQRAGEFEDGREKSASGRGSFRLGRGDKSLATFDYRRLGRFSEPYVKTSYGAVGYRLIPRLRQGGRYQEQAEDMSRIWQARHLYGMVTPWGWQYICCYLADFCRA